MRTSTATSAARRVAGADRRVGAHPDGKGYWLVGANGAVYSFGDAKYLGGLQARHLNSPIVGMAATPNGSGYILLGHDGGVFAFGERALLRLDRWHGD